MRCGNPTQIRLGMTGTFFNRTYHVVGRAVLGVNEAGRAYYWNEFYLTSAGGGPATLVFEETETGCAWRLFTMFDPRKPITAAEAATIKEGEAVDIDGTPARVTRVDQSRIYRVEGKTPEGIAPDKLANYFNAEAGSRLIVVSWTGEEMEFYSGMSTSAPLVASAFRLQGFAAWRFTATSGRSWFNSQIWMPAALILAFFGILAVCFVDITHHGRATAVTVINAPASPLRVGAIGVLDYVQYKIIGHELTDIAEVGRRWPRHEYDLTATDNNEALLVYDSGSAGPFWLLCTLLHVDYPLTPMGAGSMLPGQTLKADGSVVSIKELFRSTIRSAEGVSTLGGSAGDVFYGFTGVMISNRVLIVRWNQTNIVYLRGMPVAGKAVLEAFGSTNRLVESKNEH
jgi:hypothetical protein